MYGFAGWDASVKVCFVYVRQEKRLNATRSYYRVTALLRRDQRGVLLNAIDQETKDAVTLRQINLSQLTLRERKPYIEHLRADMAEAVQYAHPAVVSPRGVHVEGENAFLVMDPLYDAIALETQSALPIPLAADLALQALDVLIQAQTRDNSRHALRMRNFFATQDCRLRIIEFGLDPGDIGDVLGGDRAQAEEASMMTPEHCVGEIEDQKSDQFAIGCLLYRMLTGVFPFHGANYTDTVTRIAKEPHISLIQMRQDVPEKLNEVIDRVLAKKPSSRYERLSAFANALQAFTVKGTMPDVFEETGASTETLSDFSIAEVSAKLKRLEQETVDEIARALTQIIGPIAPILVQRGKRNVTDRKSLIARCIEQCEPSDTVRFLALLKPES